MTELDLVLNDLRKILNRKKWRIMGNNKLSLKDSLIQLYGDCQYSIDIIESFFKANTRYQGYRNMPIVYLSDIIAKACIKYS